MTLTSTLTVVVGRPSPPPSGPQTDRHVSLSPATLRTLSLGTASRVVLALRPAHPTPADPRHAQLQRWFPALPDSRAAPRELPAVLVSAGASAQASLEDGAVVVSAALAHEAKLRSGDTVRVALVNPVALDQVVVFAASHADYERCQTDEFRDAALAGLCVVAPDALLKVGDVSVRVGLCSPVSQGILDAASSELLVVGPRPDADGDDAGSEGDAGETEAAAPGSPRAASPPPQSRPATGTATEHVPVRLRAPTAMMVSAKSLGRAFQPTVGAGREGAFAFAAPVGQQLAVRRLLRPLPKVHPECSTRDVFSEAVVSLATLASLQIFSGSWATIEAESAARVARVYAAEGAADAGFPLEDGVIYLTPNLITHLGISPSGVVSVRRFLAPANPGAGALEEWTSRPPPAAEVVISRVRSPHSDGHTSYSQALRAYFAAPRVLAKDDVFGMPLAANVAGDDGDRSDSEDEDAGPSGQNPASFVFFKVVRVALAGDGEPETDESAWVDKDSGCRLIQRDAVQARVPPNLAGFLCGVPCEPPASLSEPYETLVSLAEPCLHPLAARLSLTCSVLLYGARGCGKTTLVNAVANRLGLHVIEVNAYELIGNSEAKTEASVKALFADAQNCAPCVLLIRRIGAFGKVSTPGVAQGPNEVTRATNILRQHTHPSSSAPSQSHPMLIIATAHSLDELAPSVQSCFRHEVRITAPDEPQRFALLEQFFKDTPLSPDVSLAAIATRTASRVAGDLQTLVAQAGAKALTRIRARFKEGKVTEADLAAAGVCIEMQDVDDTLSFLQSHHAAAIGAPKIPNVTWDDVGGLAVVKREILDTVQLPLQHPELFASGLRQRSGVLLYGPPGTGKTLLAKAVATECSLNFLSVKGPELINMYVGESEKNVRDVFEKARAARPCVIFFDELDSLAPNRGKGTDSGGVMDRIVSQLLVELDGMQKFSQVFVIGATNRPDLIDPALLRPGRFDRLLFLSVPSDNDAQVKILSALTRKYRMDPALDLAVVADKLPFTYTGADFYALCSDAMLCAIKRVINTVETRLGSSKYKVVSEYLATVDEADIQVLVTEEDFDRAQKALIPSVSEQELAHYFKLRDQFQGGRDGASGSGGGSGGPARVKGKI